MPKEVVRPSLHVGGLSLAAGGSGSPLYGRMGEMQGHTVVWRREAPLHGFIYRERGDGCGRSAPTTAGSIWSAALILRPLVN